MEIRLVETWKSLKVKSEIKKDYWKTNVFMQISDAIIFQERTL